MTRLSLARAAAMPAEAVLASLGTSGEGLSTAEAAEGLGLSDEAVKTRLHRARAMIRRAVSSRLGVVAPGAFQFLAPRCDRVVAAVLERIAAADR